MAFDAGELNDTVHTLEGSIAQQLTVVADRFDLDCGRLAALVGVDEERLGDPDSWDVGRVEHLAAVAAVSEFLASRIDVDGAREVLAAPAVAFDGDSLFEVLAAGRVRFANDTYAAAFGLRPPLS